MNCLPGSGFSPRDCCALIQAVAKITELYRPFGRHKLY
ncbi:hypothetical protein CPter291_2352 [Collimonas pratensis]|uniref:Uncharacterized protein n=1 Tax=Collimonas pratensis TaxID=279113 RepID=A0A127QX50_9BURK|nr:hypothetical protein CPter91_2972 [Collimonas pratensis]AMP14609.1 hypothetical protein CPter291_2352 [Collimonas pratensis]